MPSAFASPALAAAPTRVAVVKSSCSTCPIASKPRRRTVRIGRSFAARTQSAQSPWHGSARRIWRVPAGGSATLAPLPLPALAEQRNAYTAPASQGSGAGIRVAEERISGIVLDDPQRTLAPDGSLLVEAEVEETIDQASHIHRVIFRGLAQSDFATFVHVGDSVTVTGRVESREARDMGNGEAQPSTVFMATGFQLSGRQPIAVEGRVGVPPEELDVKGRRGPLHLAKAVVAAGKRGDGSTEWKRIVLWNDAARAFGARVRKGDFIRAVGTTIRVAEYVDRSGGERASFELTAKDFEVVGGHGEGAGEALPPLDVAEGALEGDPELRTLDSGKTLATALLLTGRLPDGRQQTQRVVLWEQTARAFVAAVRAGARVRVEGRINTKSWMDREGRERTSNDLSAVRFTLLDKQAEGQPAASPALYAAPAEGQGAGLRAEPPGGELEAVEGEVAEAPQLREVDGGRVVVNALLLTGRLPDGRQQTQRVVLWEQTARAFVAAARAGARVRVEGRMKSSSWVDREGRERTSRDLTAVRFNLLEGASGSASPAAVEPARWSRSSGFGRGAYSASHANAEAAGEADVAPF